ncbi:MAG: hypothetical protein HOG97_01585 [Candidatus Marinimicrobia bacterium]|jgi:hypothetical protein|nr:hypothetical protein [Candidatus Neomarinimicrobiota bacterium]
METKDAVQMAYDGNVSGFKETINSILLNKISNSINSVKKTEIANKFMSDSDSEQDGI